MQPAISLPPYNAHVGPQIHDDRYRRGPRVYDISALLATSIIIGAETAPSPTQLPTPGPSLSTTQHANLHTIPLRTSPPPPFAPQARILEWGHPHGNFSGDFEGPQDAEDTDGLRLLDIEPSGQATNVETVAAAASRATTGLADRGGSQPMPSSGLTPLCFSL